MRTEGSRLNLAADEQVSLVGFGEYDIVRKEWGFYATPSLNGRLISHGLRGALVRSDGVVDLVLVRLGHESRFERYLEEQDGTVIAWLASDENVDDFITRLKTAT